MSQKPNEGMVRSVAQENNLLWWQKLVLALFIIPAYLIFIPIWTWTMLVICTDFLKSVFGLYNIYRRL